MEIIYAKDNKKKRVCNADLPVFMNLSRPKCTRRRYGHTLRAGLPSVWHFKNTAEDFRAEMSFLYFFVFIGRHPDILPSRPGGSSGRGPRRLRPSVRRRTPPTRFSAANKTIRHSSPMTQSRIRNTNTGFIALKTISLYSSTIVAFMRWIAYYYAV